MNANNLIILLFPVVPLISIFFILTFKYFFKKDVSTYLLFLNNFIQLSLALYLLKTFYNTEHIIQINLSNFKYSIYFGLDRYKVFFLATYMMPLFFSLFKIKNIYEPNLKIILLFFLAGASGLIVSSDLFNFYVFYELMVMNAYILISINKKYYASYKYMIFAVLSSLFFLAGIIMFFNFTGNFNYLNIIHIASSGFDNFNIMMIMFMMAFLIKGGFFPVSSWVPCHSDTNPLVSAFLSSFSINSGILGIFYMVILPAEYLNLTNVLFFIRVISILTILTAGIFIFFEKEFKRCIAVSTCFAIGFIGLLLSSGHYELGFVYLIVHAFYKSVMFLMLDDIKLDIDKYYIYGRKSSFFIIIITVLFAAGFFPSLTYFLKKSVGTYYNIANYITYAVMIFILFGFFKFRFKKSKRPPKVNYLFYISVFFLMLYIYYYFFTKLNIQLIFDKNYFFSFLQDFLIFVFILLFSRKLLKKLKFLINIDTLFIYKNLNYEIMYIIVLFIFSMIISLSTKPILWF